MFEKGNCKIFSTSRIFLSVFCISFLFTSCQYKGRDLRFGGYKTELENYFSEKFEKIKIDQFVPVNIEFYQKMDSVKSFRNIVDLAIDNKSVYFIEKNINKVLRLDKEKGSITSLGRIGRGPSEFNEPWNIAVDEENIFVYDKGNARLQILHKSSFETITSLVANYQAGASKFDATNNFLFIPNVNFAESNEYILNVFRASEPFENIENMIPRLVELGQQPSILNSVKVNSDNQNNLYISYHGLPYILIFDKNLNYIKTIELEGRYIDEFYNEKPSERVWEAIKDIPGVVRYFIRSFAVENNILYLILRNDLIALDLENNKYLASYNIHLGDEPFYPSTVKIFEGKVYLLSTLQGIVLSGNLMSNGELSKGLNRVL
jgi:hypothetical protein